MPRKEDNITSNKSNINKGIRPNNIFKSQISEKIDPQTNIVYSKKRLNNGIVKTRSSFVDKQVTDPKAAPITKINISSSNANSARSKYLDCLKQCRLEARRSVGQTSIQYLTKNAEGKASNISGSLWSLKNNSKYSREESNLIRERYKSEIENLRARLYEIRTQKKKINKKPEPLKLGSSNKSKESESFFDYNAYKKLTSSIAKKTLVDHSLAKRYLESENRLSKYKIKSSLGGTQSVSTNTDGPEIKDNPQKALKSSSAKTVVKRKQLNVGGDQDKENNVSNNKTTEIKKYKDNTVSSKKLEKIKSDVSKPVVAKVELMTDNAKILFSQESLSSLKPKSVRTVLNRAKSNEDNKKERSSSREKAKTEVNLISQTSLIKDGRAKLKAWTTLPRDLSRRSIAISEESVSNNKNVKDEVKIENEIKPVETMKSEEKQEIIQVKDQFINRMYRCLESGDSDSFSWSLRHSLFPNVPPYWKFIDHDAKQKIIVPYIARRLFKWKLTNITPIVIRKVLVNSGFILTKSSNDWVGTWGKHMKSMMYKELKETQKLNHFPGTYHLGRKDRLWRNLQVFIEKFGELQFGFMPYTYILPEDTFVLREDWFHKNNAGSDGKWIIKPPASARGIGIKVINKWSEIPKKISRIAQLYISRPYIINGNKFDLRLYVLVTSFCPLKIYLWPEGLARFASMTYTEDEDSLSNRFIHLTNYSVNKESTNYTKNDDANACQGHKWTLTKLFEYLADQGKDTRQLWQSFKDIIIKSLISSESFITELCQENITSRYCCYELFGVDILLDYSLKPWLIEINISPSLHTSSPLDTYVKAPLVTAILNLAQFHIPPRALINATKEDPEMYDQRLYTTTLTKKEKSKHYYFERVKVRREYLSDILVDLTGDDVRHLLLAEDELEVKGDFERIFPTANTHSYLTFMEPRYYNRLFDAWEQNCAESRVSGITRLQKACAGCLHLKLSEESIVNTYRFQNEIQLSDSPFKSKMLPIFRSYSIADRTSFE